MPGSVVPLAMFSQVEKMVEEFDDDGSGLIEFEEFLVLMAKKVEIPP